MTENKILDKLDAIFDAHSGAPYETNGLKNLTSEIKKSLGEYLFQVNYKQGSVDDFGCGWEATVEYWSDDNKIGDTYLYYFD